MESHKCRFCSKSFVNGRALDGHMRSFHMPSLHKFSVDEEEERPSQLSYVSSSSSEEEDGKRNGSKKKKVKTSQLGFKNETELEHPQSSTSDTTTEEDLAFCLMMLSRDKWKKKKTKTKSTYKEVVEEIDTEESEGYNKSNRTRYKCETCGKVFKSYQALGGHRASHKKNRVSNKTEQRSETEYDDVVVVVAEKRIHECPICLRVFPSGQALGGHKRSHGIGSWSINHHQVHKIESAKQRMIDLNLPAPTHEEDVSVVFQ